MTATSITFTDRLARLVELDKKTQTRRVIALPGPGWDLDRVEDDDGIVVAVFRNGSRELRKPCGYKVGSTLKVRQCWRVRKEYDPVGAKALADRSRRMTVHVHYTSDDAKPDAPSRDDLGRLRAAMHMPLRFARTRLEVLDVGIERVQNIDEEDAIAEGVASLREFASLWEQINGPRGWGWESNPWTFAIEFSRFGAPAR